MKSVIKESTLERREGNHSMVPRKVDENILSRMEVEM